MKIGRTPGGSSLSDMDDMTLRGGGTQRGSTLRDMYQSVDVLVEKDTQTGFTLRNMYLTVEVLLVTLSFYSASV